MILKLTDGAKINPNKLQICKAIKEACEIGLKEAKGLVDILFMQDIVDLRMCVANERAGIPLDKNKVIRTFENIPNIILVDDGEERKLKLEELLTELKLLSNKKDTLPDYYFSEVTHKEISLETGFCRISGKNIEDVEIDIYFTLNNYTIIC